MGNRQLSLSIREFFVRGYLLPCNSDTVFYMFSIKSGNMLPLLYFALLCVWNVIHYSYISGKIYYYLLLEGVKQNIYLCVLF